MTLTTKDFDTVAKPDWCPGCGDFGIQAAMKMALAKLGIEPHKIALVAGIGCSSKMPHWVDTYGLHTLHGRAVPPAAAIKLVNPKLTVLINAGDGDAYGIGVGHLVHMMRRNIDLTYIVHNNMVYGLTKGQATPTSAKGYKSPSTPFGAIEEPLNPIALALSMGATFIARGVAGDVQHLAMLIEEGVKHKGFALIDVFQPCVTFNKINTYPYFMQRVYKLESDASYDKTNFEMAMKKAWETEKLPIGIFYQVSKQTYEEQEPGMADVSATELDISNVDISKTMEKYI